LNLKDVIYNTRGDWHLLRQKAEFEFHHAGQVPEFYHGTFVQRETEMVLDIEVHGGTSYLILGRLDLTGIFEGVNEGPVAARAKWMRFDERYIGFWIEEGREFLFVIRPIEE
jgi:hypothetical protein